MVVFDSLEPQLLKPRVGVKLFRNLTHVEMKRVLSNRKRKKFGFKDTAVIVIEHENHRYDVRLEYIY